MAETEPEMEKLLEEAKKLGIDVSNYEEESTYGSPEEEKKESIYRFFRDLLQYAKTWKISNLSNTEIGATKLGARHYLSLAQYAKIEGLHIVSNYFTGKANIIAEPAMSRKGFLSQLFVTQIKKEQKLKEQPPEKKTWFGKNVEGGEQYEQ